MPRLPHLFVVIGIAASAAAGAAPLPRVVLPHWQVLAWSEPVVVSVDLTSITGHAARLTARVLWDYAAAQSMAEPTGSPYRSMIGVLVFDCAGGRFGGAASVAYSLEGGQGEALARYSIEPEAAKLSIPDPGTLAQDLLDFVCGRDEKAVPAPL
jgi:hypothetical protein